jgi:hypothetical protein
VKPRLSRDEGIAGGISGICRVAQELFSDQKSARDKTIDGETNSRLVFTGEEGTGAGDGGGESQADRGGAPAGEGGEEPARGAAVEQD